MISEHRRNSRDYTDTSTCERRLCRKKPNSSEFGYPIATRPSRREHAFCELEATYRRQELLVTSETLRHGGEGRHAQTDGAPGSPSSFRDRGERNFFSHGSPAAASLAAACRSQFRARAQCPDARAARARPLPGRRLLWKHWSIPRAPSGWDRCVHGSIVPNGAKGSWHAVPARPDLHMRLRKGRDLSSFVAGPERFERRLPESKFARTFRSMPDRLRKTDEPHTVCPPAMIACPTTKAAASENSSQSSGVRAARLFIRLQ
jgi:hypothetical protein